ncbi:MAG: DinB family protein [Gammaproteobacteria bacterium]|jgi:uncharacterized damage-inducible protein DinB
MHYMQLLARYKAWADDLFLSTLFSQSREELTAPRSIPFGSLIRTLNHSCAMDFVWQCHLLGNPHGLSSRNPEQCPEIEELAACQRNMNRWYVEYVDSLSEEGLAQKVEFEFIGGGNGCMTRRDILLHVVNHATYHRGQAAAILYQLGVTPATTDLPVFLREQSGAF